MKQEIVELEKRIAADRKKLMEMMNKEGTGAGAVDNPSTSDDAPKIDET